MLSPAGRSGYILPHKFFNAQYGRNLRELIARGRHLSEIVHFGHHQVFDSATTYTCLLFLDRKYKESCRFVKVHDLDAWRCRMDEVKKAGAKETPTVAEDNPVYQIERPSIDEVATIGEIPVAQLTGDEWNFGVGKLATLLRKLQAHPVTLGSVAEIFVGLQTSADRVFVLPLAAPIEDGATKPFLLTGELTPYARLQPSAKLIFPYQIDAGSARLVPAAEMKSAFPNAWRHLEDNRKELAAREHGKWNHAQWYAFGRSQNLTQMQAPKLVVQVTARRPTVMLDESGLHMTGGGSGPFYGVRPKADALSLRFLLGVMNSKLFGVMIRAQSTDLRGGYIKFSKQ